MEGDVATRRLDEVVASLLGSLDPGYFRDKRWFGSKTRWIQGSRVLDFGSIRGGADPQILVLLELLFAQGDPETYQVPLAFAAVERVPPAVRERGDAALRLETEGAAVWAFDAVAEDSFCAELYRNIAAGRSIPTHDGSVAFHHVPGRVEDRAIERIERVGTEQSNTSIVYDGRLILKLFRRLAPGPNPDFEVPFYLTTQTDFDHAPKVAGFIEYRPASGPSTSLGVLQDFVPNRGDGYTNFVRRCREYLEDAELHLGDEAGPAEASPDPARDLKEEAYRLGSVTGLMHNALGRETDLVSFRPEPITRWDTAAWERGIAAVASQTLGMVRERLGEVPLELRDMLRRIVQSEPAVLDMIGGLATLEGDGLVKIRFHGDYHLGQVLETERGFTILDFEGEPARSLAERRAKGSPIRDVAGMLRSFSYAASAALFSILDEHQEGEAAKEALERPALRWEDLARAAFLDGYRDATNRHEGPPYVPTERAAFNRLVRVFEVEKALYELRYEFNNRPAWVPIPARGLLRLLDLASGGPQ